MLLKEDYTMVFDSYYRWLFSPLHVLVSAEMVNPEGQAQEKPPMILLHE